MKQGLSKRELLTIVGVLAVCAAILVVVVMLFFQLGDISLPQQTVEAEETPSFTGSAAAEPASTPSATPSMTPIPTDVVVIPETDGPVFFGVSSSISVDCVDPRYVKNQVIDRLFYLGYTEGDYTVTEEEAVTVLRLRVELDQEAFADLYTQMLKVIYDGTVEQHLENGTSVDQNGIESDDQYSYLTMYFYAQE